MKKISLWCVLVLGCNALVFGQSPQLPWSALNNGGSSSSANSLWLTSSVGQPAPANQGSVNTLVFEGGYIPGVRLLAGTNSTVAQQAATGWNMISVPLLVSDYHKSTLYPSATSNAFYYSGGYAVALVLTNGTGYWLQYTSPTAVSVTGTAFTAETLQVLQNWNMVGPPSYPLLKSSVIPNGTSIMSQYFGYKSGIGYVVADTLKPGNAYWVQVSANGTLILPSGGFEQTKMPSSPVVHEGSAQSVSGNSLLSSQQWGQVKDFNSVLFRDANGIERTLYYSATKPSVDLSSFALPPVAPDKLLDVRFASQRIVEATDAAKAKNSFSVLLSGGTYPLTVSWTRGSEETGGDLVMITEDGKKAVHSLRNAGQLVISDPQSFVGLRLELSKNEGKVLPREFALYQNYPNPFNPSTTIRYDVPTASRVKLRVFNLLGEEVQRLVDEAQEAGTYDVRLNGEGLASGVYFYRLETGNATFTRKLMLLK